MIEMEDEDGQHRDGTEAVDFWTVGEWLRWVGQSGSGKAETLGERGMGKTCDLKERGGGRAET
jgi:hypothetical protein